MKTIELNIYSFEELSEEAKQAAIENYRNVGIETQYYWDEAHESVKAFNNIFNTDEGYDSWLDIRTGRIDDDILELKGLRLRTYIINNFWNQITNRKYLKTGKSREECPKYHKMRKTHLIKQGQNKGLYFSQYYSNLQRTKDCPLTRVCYDHELLTPFWNFVDNYREYTSADYQTLENLIKYAFEDLRKSLESEDEYRSSDEAITEEIIANNWEFTEDGEMY